MSKPVLLVLIAPALIALSAPPQQKSDEAARIATVATLGANIYLMDRAAWVASDALTAKLPRDRLTGIGGWVIERGGDRLVVTFYRDKGDAARAFFVVDVRNGKVTNSRLLDAPVAMTQSQLRLVHARDAATTEAVARGYRPCTSAPFNTVILPPIGPESPTLVYLLSAQVENGTYPIGGHYRIVVGPDGKVVSSRPFTKSCINMTPKAGPRGETPAGLFVNHILDPLPTEAHVFSSFAARMPVLVGTGDKRVWEVKGNEITISKMKAPAPPG